MTNKNKIFLEEISINLLNINKMNYIMIII